MEAVDDAAGPRDDRLALLFTPPFDHSPQDPGYIKGYPPGIRENGGQYTHGSQWSIFALAKLGQGDAPANCSRCSIRSTTPTRPRRSARYKVEPYVACADVYSVAPHVGRGGWTWYTGSARWLYRAGLEAILGFQLRGDQSVPRPVHSRDWPGFSISTGMVPAAT